MYQNQGSLLISRSIKTMKMLVSWGLISSDEMVVVWWFILHLRWFCFVVKVGNISIFICECDCLLGNSVIDLHQCPLCFVYGVCS